MDYQIIPASGNSYTHQWDVSSAKVFEGGFLFDKTTVPEGTEKIPRGSLIKVDFVERTVSLVKTAVLFEALTALATAVKIKKGSLLLATDILGTGTKTVTVGTINTSNANYDSFAIEADALGVLAEGAVLQQFTAVEDGTTVNPDGLNYREELLDAEPSCDVIYAVDGIKTEALPQGITDAIEAALPRCQFL